MNIEIGKWYRTRGGEKAYVACEMPGPVKFCGYHIQGPRAVPTGWFANGSYMPDGPTSADLVDLWIDKPVVDWSKEPAWVKAIAMSSGGRWYRFAEVPVLEDGIWWSAEVYRIHESEYPYWTGDWKNSLVVRPS